MSQALLLIRGAIKQRLANRIDEIGDSVSTNRADMVWNRHLPAIVIYTKTELDNRVQGAPPSYDCTASVVIDILAQDDSGLPLDDVIDRIAGAVRDLMYHDPRLQRELPGVVADAKLVSYSVLVQDGGERLIAGGQLTWEFVYHDDAPEGDPAEIAPFKLAHTQFSLDPSAGA